MTREPSIGVAGEAFEWVPGRAEATAAAAAAGSGQDGIQYLCSKYSSLISRLREEVLQRQDAEGKARVLDRKLQEESKHWEVERRTLQEELQVLRSRLQPGVPDRWLCHRCGNAQPNLQAAADLQACPWPDGVAASGGALAQQEALERLRRENAELRAQRQDGRDELATCREHLARWRTKASELDARSNKAERGLEESEGRTRFVQEEMRQALRVASVARAREQQAALCAGRGDRELKAREERLLTLRRETQRQAKRAGSAERRLALAEAAEVEKLQLQQQAQQLQMRLGAALEATECIRKDMARAEQAEATARCDCAEAQGQLRATEVLQAAQAARCGDLIAELQALRQRFEGLDAARTGTVGQRESLQSELHMARAALVEQEQSGHRLREELQESRRRLERGAVPQITECQRRLGSCEDALARSRAEVTEERKSRERCHLEALRAGEKLRLARSQGTQLRDKLRALEEAGLRYPSRSCVAATPRSAREVGSARLEQKRSFSLGSLAAPAPPIGSWQVAECSFGPTGLAVENGLDRPERTADFGTQSLGYAGWQSEEPTAREGIFMPTGGSTASGLGAYLAAQGPLSPPQHADVQSVRNFIAEEERRLGFAANETAFPAGIETRLSWAEEPRSAAPSQVKFSSPSSFRESRNYGVNHIASRGQVGAEASTAGPADADLDISILLAAEPRVLKLPEPLQFTPSGPAVSPDVRRAGA